MKSINKLFRKKKSKIGTVAKVLLPIAGVVAAKKLWDNKESLITGDIRSKILDTTEAVQDKVQQFHDFVQNSADESVETIFVDEPLEKATGSGEKTDDIEDEITTENVEKTEENLEDSITETTKTREEN